MRLGIVTLIIGTIGIANAGATGALWCGRVRSTRTAFPRQAGRVVSSLICVTISSLTYLAFLAGWLYNPGEFNGLTRLGTGSILLGLLTAGYAFLCTMVGDAQSRPERIRIFVSAVMAGLLWLLAIVGSAIPPV